MATKPLEAGVAVIPTPDQLQFAQYVVRRQRERALSVLLTGEHIEEVNRRRRGVTLAFGDAWAHDVGVPAVVAGPATRMENLMNDLGDPGDRQRGAASSPVAGEAPALTTPLVGLGGGTSRGWTPTDRELPPNGVVVATMDSGGHVQTLKRDGRLWWFPDGSMYVYYTPTFWQTV